MALLSDLVETLAYATGIPHATVFAYGRFAREAGFINQKGRGRGAAEMTVRDAANLLIAVCGTEVTRDAGIVIEEFRKLEGTVLTLAEEFKGTFLDWFAPLGYVQDGRDLKLVADFGTTLEFLIQEAGQGNLHGILSEIPTYKISDELWEQWASEDSPNLNISVDEMIKLGLVEPGFNKHVTCLLGFSRTWRTVEIIFSREWGGEQQLFRILFEAPGDLGARSTQNLKGFRVWAFLNEQSLVGLGAALQGALIPEDYWPVDFFKLFGIQEVPPVEHALRSPKARDQAVQFNDEEQAIRKA